MAVPPLAGAVIVNVRFGNVLPLLMTAVLVQVIVPPDGAPHDQFVPDPLAPLTPAGSVFTTVVVPLVGSGPLFVIWTVYVSVLAAFTLIGALRMMARSDDCGVITAVSTTWVAFVDSTNEPCVPLNVGRFLVAKSPVTDA